MSSMMLTDYFMPSRGSAAAPGPGRSEETALFLTVPQQPHSGDDRAAVWQEFRTQMDNISLDCTLLTPKFLKHHKLHSYTNAAAACANQDDVVETLKYLVPTPGDGSATFTAIILPSGTGKTQLAATAAYTYDGAVRFLLLRCQFPRLCSRILRTSQGTGKTATTCVAGL